jgi:hypothetical protein
MLYIINIIFIIYLFYLFYQLCKNSSSKICNIIWNKLIIRKVKRIVLIVEDVNLKVIFEEYYNKCKNNFE